MRLIASLLLLVLCGCTYGGIHVYQGEDLLASGQYISVLQKKSLVINPEGQIRYSTDSQAAVEMLRESRLGWERAFNLGSKAAVAGAMP